MSKPDSEIQLRLLLYQSRIDSIRSLEPYLSLNEGTVHPRAWNRAQREREISKIQIRMEELRWALTP